MGFFVLQEQNTEFSPKKTFAILIYNYLSVGTCRQITSGWYLIISSNSLHLLEDQSRASGGHTTKLSFLVPNAEIDKSINNLIDHKNSILRKRLQKGMIEIYANASNLLVSKIYKQIRWKRLIYVTWCIDRQSK